MLYSPSALAMDTFSLIGTNYDVGECGATLENEHGIRLARLCLPLANYRGAIILLHASIKAATDRDSHRG